jgi:hypothetical protein
MQRWLASKRLFEEEEPSDSHASGQPEAALSHRERCSQPENYGHREFVLRSENYGDALLKRADSAV